MYLNEQFAAQGVEVVAILVVIAIGLLLSRHLERRHQRRLEELRLASLAVVNSIEQLLAQTARDIERKSQPPSSVLAKVDAHRLKDVLDSRLAEFASERPAPETATEFCDRVFSSDAEAFLKGRR